VGDFGVATGGGITGGHQGLITQQTMPGKVAQLLSKNEIMTESN